MADEALVQEHACEEVKQDDTGQAPDMVATTALGSTLMESRWLLAMAYADAGCCANVLRQDRQNEELEDVLLLVVPCKAAGRLGTGMSLEH